MSDFDDLLGGEADLPVAPHGRDFTMKMNSVHMVANHGVTVPWLVQAFGIPRNRVEKMLSGAPVLRLQRNGGKIYDFVTAASFLVKPRISVKEYINSLEPNKLPRHLQKEFWAAKLAEQRWRKQAGELWASEDVIAVFGEVFKLIKEKTRQWQNTVTAADPLTHEQIEVLQTLVEDLLDKIHGTLVALESGQTTASQIAEADEDADENE